MSPGRAAAAGLGLLLASGCNGQFHPETLVDSMRVLSVVAEPPEVRPGGRSSLSVLQVDPSRPGGVTSIFWLGCDPDPVGFDRSTCADVSALLQFSSFQDYPKDVSLLGFGDSADYPVRAGLFDGLDAGDPVRFNGTAGPVLTGVVGAQVTPTTSIEDLRTLFGQMQRGEVVNVLALTRVSISERAALNHNPSFSGLEVDGVALPAGATVQVRPGAPVRLHLQAPASAREAYQVLLPGGAREDRVETLVAAWYSTAGRFSPPRVDLAGDGDTVFTAPGGSTEDPVPARRFGNLWTVLRDDRGGEASQTLRFYVCDGSPTPTLTSLTPPASPADQATLTGTDLDSVLDVVVGGQALRRLRHDAAREVLVGDLPPLEPGTWPVRVRARNCADADTRLTVVVPGP